MVVPSQKRRLDLKNIVEFILHAQKDLAPQRGEACEENNGQPSKFEDGASKMDPTLSRQNVFSRNQRLVARLKHTV
jgi:hypothetical protein